MSGITSKLEVGDDDEAAEAAVAESSRRALTEVLGAERRDRILSALYVARQDAVHVVRQSAIHIWKALVHNTPRTGVLRLVGAFCSGCSRVSSARDFIRVGGTVGHVVCERRDGAARGACCPCACLSLLMCEVG